MENREQISQKHRERKIHLINLNTMQNALRLNFNHSNSLKQNKDHVCVQMDFAENYSIKEMEEIQSAY